MDGNGELQFLEVSQRKQIFSSSKYQSRSPCSSSARSFPHQQCDQPSCCRTLTPERLRTKHFEVPSVQNAHGLERPGSAGSSRMRHDSSGSSSTCSSNVSAKVLDRYIDGEQEELSRQKNSSWRWRRRRWRNLQTKPINTTTATITILTIAEALKIQSKYLMKI
ncbi:hypothetical protein TB2_045443 [Malus domestica]